MGIEHAAGVYIGLLILALLVAVVANRYAHLPYTIALVVIGLVVGLLKLGPHPEEIGFGREIIFFVLLPPLLFHGALHLELSRLLRHFWPIFTFAIIGVAVSTAVIGGVLVWVGGLSSILVALLLGSMLSPTDPVSVLALFKEAGVSKDLRHLVEGESLFNDGTGVVLFGILLGLIKVGGSPDVGAALLMFAKVVGGGLLIGIGAGYVTWLFLRTMTDPVLETCACLVLALGSFWIAESVHLSGVIATVTAGLLIGNHGKHLSMSSKGTASVNGFFSVTDFLINSILFLLIGLEIRAVEGTSLTAHLPLAAAGVLGLLVARAIVVYPSWRLLNLAGTQRPPKWGHVLFWGGLRGSIPIALLLWVLNDPKLPASFHEQFDGPLLVVTFGVVMFSLIVQGLTIMPLLKWLGIGGDDPEPEEHP